MAIQESERLQEYVDDLLKEDEDGGMSDLLADECDSSCTSGYDNDGSTGLEIFRNGFRLAEKAEGDVLMVRDGGSPPVAYFFLGTEEEVLQKIRLRVAEEARLST
jgi:hypothetical protein